MNHYFLGALTMSTLMTSSLPATATQHIIKTDDISITATYIPKEFTTTLVLFDLDHTLLTLDPSKHDYLDQRGYIGIEYYIKELIAQGLTKEEVAKRGMKRYIDLTQQDPPSMIPVDAENTVTTFNKIKVAADTMLLTGRPWALCKETSATLRKNNLALSLKMSDRCIIPESKECPPFQCKDGIIYTMMQCKGAAFKSFFSTFNTFPYKLIIFIDDSKNHINSLAETCKDLDLDYVGIVYTKMHHPEHAPINYSQESANQ